VYDLQAGRVVEEALAFRPVRFPYVPGLLSFREVPAILAAARGLKTTPDLFMFDGQGYAHPRRFGLACHAGLLLGLPAIGAAKSRLIGRHDEPPPRAGSLAPLMDRGERIGVVLRTRDRVKPLYVSVGHRLTLEDAVAVTLACVTRYRLPEPTRLAHQLVSRNKGG
ncbi:MAG: endonuclease V, partial [Phycisphaerae bacterium]|jgi:deoxyribonuclease V